MRFPRCPQERIYWQEHRWLTASSCLWGCRPHASSGWSQTMPGPSQAVKAQPLLSRAGGFLPGIFPVNLPISLHEVWSELHCGLRLFPLSLPSLPPFLAVRPASAPSSLPAFYPSKLFLKYIFSCLIAPWRPFLEDSHWDSDTQVLGSVILRRIHVQHRWYAKWMILSKLLNALSLEKSIKNIMSQISSDGLV